jgi:hypothetical protein
MLLSYEAILADGGHVDADFEALETNQPNAYFGDDRVPFSGMGSGTSSLLTAEDVSITTLKETSMGKWDSKDLRHWLTNVLEARVSEEEPGADEEGLAAKAKARMDLHITLVDRVIDHVDEVRSKRIPGVGGSDEEGKASGQKRRYLDVTPSFFGSTTMSHRNKKFYEGGGGAGGVGGKRPVGGGKARAGLSRGLAGGRGITGTSTGQGNSGSVHAVVTSGQVFMRANLEAVFGGSHGMPGVTAAQINEVVIYIRSALKTRSERD